MNSMVGIYITEVDTAVGDMGYWRFRRGWKKCHDVMTEDTFSEGQKLQRTSALRNALNIAGFINHCH